MKRLVLVLCVLMMAASSALAHSGGTDSSGGHWNHKTGEYHYHHGYGAHQHPNGVCPYTKKAAASSDKPMIYPDDGEGLKTTGNVNMRTGPGTDNRLVTTLTKGSSVVYQGQSSGRWHYVKYGAVYGWVYNDYLEIDASRPAPTEEPEPTITEKPVKKQSKKEPAKLTFKTGLWLFAAGFIAGMVILARYSFKVHERERMLQQSIKRTSEAFLEGKNSALNEVREKEKHLAFVAEFNKDSFERYKAEAEKIYASLPPADAYCRVIVANSGQGCQLYHRVGSKCVENGKEVPIFVANMLGLLWCPVCMPPTKGKPMNPWVDTKEKRVEMVRNLLDGGK